MSSSSRSKSCLLAWCSASRGRRRGSFVLKLEFPSLFRPFSLRRSCFFKVIYEEIAAEDSFSSPLGLRVALGDDLPSAGSARWLPLVGS